MEAYEAETAGTPHAAFAEADAHGRYDRDSSGEISRNEVFAMATDKGFNAVHHSLHAAPAPNIPSRGRVHHCGDIVLVGSRRLAAAAARGSVSALVRCFS